jgi:hypothetical protein
VLWRTRQTAGKILASQAATQIAEAKKRRGKRTRSAVSTDTTTTVSSDVETIDVEDNKGDVQSPKATTAPSPRGQAAEMPHPAPRAQGRATSSTDPAGDFGSNKRMKKAPPKPCKSDLRLATK